MSVIGTINSRVYDTVDFNAVDYANRIQQLIGDIYVHFLPRRALTSATSLAVATGSKAFTINNNLSSSNPDYAVGECVYARPMIGMNGVDRRYRDTWMSGVISAISGTVITVNVLAARGSGTYASWMIAPIGDNIQTLANPLAVTNGGLGSATLATGKANIGVGAPTAQIKPIFEDFLGTVVLPSVSSGHGYSESFDIYDHNKDSVDFVGNFSPHGLLTGDTEQFNVDPNVTQPVTASDWASHPGIIMLAGGGPGTTGGAMICTKNAGSGGIIQFPYSGDLFEVMFRVPDGYTTPICSFGFTAASSGGDESAVVMNIGVDTLPYIKTCMAAPDMSAMSGLPGGFSVVTGNTGGSPTSVCFPSTYRILSGIWYRARFTSTSCTLYIGTTQVAQITSLTFPTLVLDHAMEFTLAAASSDPNTYSGVLLDYYYYRHNTTR